MIQKTCRPGGLRGAAPVRCGARAAGWRRCNAFRVNWADVHFVECSLGARQLFEKAVAEAALFHLPIDAHPPGTDGALADQILPPLRAWQERGIMPYRLTATSLLKDSDKLGGVLQIQLTSVFSESEPERLEWVSRSRVVAEDGLWRRDLYAVFKQRDDDQIDLMRVNREVAKESRDIMGATVAWSLRHFMWLIHALSSVEYTAVEERVSRPVARATGMPRTTWRIHLRKRGSRTEPSMRQQFAEVVRAAHAVRGHLRTHHRTGEKSIRVRPHVRGKGDVVQIKDYVLHPDDNH